MATEPSTGSNRTHLGRRVMRMRDPLEPHRASTPLELFLDLCFAAAVSQAAAQLHQAIGADQLGTALAGYAAVFFAIWWAWVNFTWFASAFDTDDVAYRLLTLVQMAGVLVLAAGVPSAFQRGDFTIVVIGYVLMRIAMITQWLRASLQHPAARSAALRYALGIGIVQLGWIARLWASGVWSPITFIVLVVAELSVPAWAEFGGRATSWHPGHIADRYAGFTIIVLGEVVLATLVAVQSDVRQHGLSASLLLIAVGGLVLVFALWWIAFSGEETRLTSLRIALAWGYGHYIVLAAIAAIGAGLDVAAGVGAGSTHLPVRVAALSVNVPVVVVLIVLALLHRLAGSGAVGHPLVVLAGAAAVLAWGFSAPAIGLSGAVLGTGLIVAATLATNLAMTDHRQRRAIG